MMQETQGVQIKGRSQDDFVTITQDGARYRLDVTTGLATMPGFNIPPFDTINATYPTTTQEVYVYKLSGATVATITVNYTDTTKNYITSAVKT